MSRAIPYFARQVQKQIFKKAVTHTTGLDDFLGIRPLHELKILLLTNL
mgnify:CR=1 FL=1